MTSLRGLQYFGGKSSQSPSGTGAWIASLLPADRDVHYVEPFAGMLGVMLQRPESKLETVNDLDGRITNWWRQLRNHPDELLRRISTTPRSRETFAEAIGLIDSADEMTSAWAVSVVLLQSVRNSLDTRPSDWRRSMKWRAAQPAFMEYTHNLELVAKRIARAQIENRDAVEILGRVADDERTLVYADPPYRSAPGAKVYATSTVDVDALTDVFKAQKGRVAISGYGDEWDHLRLGWRRHEREVSAAGLGDLVRSQTATLPVKTEVLWTNFEPERPADMLDLLEDAT